MQLRFPPPLRPGDTIGVTAPSTGASGAAMDRMRFCIEWLTERGFRVRVGECLESDGFVSAPKAERAAELNAMLLDPDVRAVVPPWGGVTSIDLLDLIDYDAIAQAEPTWVVGYSDSTTWMVPLTTRAGLATLHGDNLADTPYDVPDGLVSWLDLASATDPVSQRDSELVATWVRFDDDSRATTWRETGHGQWDLYGAARLDVTGTLIGGCVETLAPACGAGYADLRAFGAEHGPLIVYLEVAEDSAFDICRLLHQFRLAGSFDHAVAILIGRTSAPDETALGGLTQREAVLDALGDLGLPIVFDMEIGHVPPHLPLLNGATARIVVDGDVREITQSWRRTGE